MNIIKKVMIATGTASVALAPIAASAAAAPLSTALSTRAAPSAVEGSDLRGREGRGSAVLLALLALGAIAVAIVIAVDQEDDTPVSA